MTLGSKWCEWCYAELEMSLNECKFCDSSSFLHQNPGRAQIDPWEARDKRAKRDYEKNISLPQESTGTYKPKWKVEEAASEEVLASQVIATPKSEPKKEETSTKAATIPATVLSDDIHKFIQAQNRTTHAVRAFVLFLFYQLTAITLAYVIYSFAQVQGNQSDDCEPLLRQFGACEPEPTLVFLALVIWIAGVVYSSQIGWREIQKSEVL